MRERRENRFDDGGDVCQVAKKGHLQERPLRERAGGLRGREKV